MKKTIPFWERYLHPFPWLPLAVLVATAILGLGMSLGLLKSAIEAVR